MWAALVKFHDRLIGWRTILFNALPSIALVAGELAQYLSTFRWEDLGITSHVAMLITLGFNVGNIMLRSITTTPVGVAPPPAPTV